MKADYYIKQIEALASDLMKANEGWRYGQSVFNATYNLYPNVAEQLIASPWDCFYRDGLAGAFIDKAAELLCTTEQNPD